ncbi:MAG: hypothetical protein OHK0052_00640 [Anaerolineales bacterium]
MKRTLTLFIALALWLTACAAPAAEPTRAPQPVEPIPTATPENSAPTPQASATPQEEPNPTQPAGMQTYVIIPGESQVSYEVGETFFNQNNRFNVAIGTTSQINGQITLDPANPANSSISTIEIDISQFQSDSSRRDGVIRDRYLESARYPIAVFVPTAIEGLPSTYTPGELLTFGVTGDLTVRQTTRSVTFDVTARLDGDTLSGSAMTTILMSDFGVGPIEIAGILGTEDEVKLSFNFVARP